MELRIPPPLVTLAAALIMWGLSQLAPATRIAVPGAAAIAVLLAAAGVVVAVLGVTSFRRTGTTVNPHTPEKASTLVVHGPYRYSRNPMYLGLALVLLGWAVFLGNLPALLVLPAFIFYMNRYQIAPEERALEARFGADYVRYRQSVGRWL